MLGYNEVGNDPVIIQTSNVPWLKPPVCNYVTQYSGVVALPTSASARRLLGVAAARRGALIAAYAEHWSWSCCSWGGIKLVMTAWHNVGECVGARHQVYVRPVQLGSAADHHEGVNDAANARGAAGLSELWTVRFSKVIVYLHREAHPRVQPHLPGSPRPEPLMRSPGLHSLPSCHLVPQSVLLLEQNKGPNFRPRLLRQLVAISFRIKF